MYKDQGKKANMAGEHHDQPVQRAGFWRTRRPTESRRQRSGSRTPKAIEICETRELCGKGGPKSTWGRPARLWLRVGHAGQGDYFWAEAQSTWAEVEMSTEILDAEQWWRNQMQCFGLSGLPQHWGPLRCCLHLWPAAGTPRRLNLTVRTIPPCTTALLLPISSVKPSMHTPNEVSQGYTDCQNKIHNMSEKENKIQNFQSKLYIGKK